MCVYPFIRVIHIGYIKIERRLRLRILKKTRSVCPMCLKEIDAFIYKRGKKVYMNKTCSDHDTFDVPLGDSELYRKTMNNHASLQQKTPISLMVPVTHKCNLNCPVCYLPYTNLPQISINDFKKLVDNFEGQYIRISGGEPTLRDDLCRLISHVSQTGKKSSLLSNGIKLADESYVKRLKESGLNTIHFPLNGLDRNVLLLTDGKDLLRKKLKALENLKKHDIATCLSTLLIRGINEGQVKGIFDYYLKNNQFVYEWRIRSAVQIGRDDKITPYPVSEMLEILCNALQLDKRKIINSYRKTRNYHFSPCQLDLSLFYFNENNNFRLLFPEVNTYYVDKIKYSKMKRYYFGYKLAKNGGVKNLVYYIRHKIWGDGKVLVYNIKLRSWPTKHTIDLGETSYCPSRNLAEDGKVYPFCYSLLVNEKIMYPKKEDDNEK